MGERMDTFVGSPETSEPEPKELDEETEGLSGRHSSAESIDSEGASSQGFGSEGEEEPRMRRSRARGRSQVQATPTVTDGWDTDLEIEEEKEEYDVTGSNLYVQTCKTLGIIPASRFLRNLQAQESHINLRYRGVGPKGTKAIAVALTNNTSVTHVDLKENGLGLDGAIAIATMMKENCYITHLDLSNNYMGTPAAHALAPIVNTNSTLVHLTLGGNGFDDKAAEPLADLIRGSFHIKFLDLSHNQFGEDAGMVLGPALADCEVLQTLDLSWNHIRRKGCAAIAEGVKNNQSLKVVSLAFNGFDNQGAVAIADALKLNSTLEELDISYNRITTDGAVVLSKVLPVNDTIKTLKIAHNSLQMPGVIALLDAIKMCSSTTLQQLNLDGITITLAVEKMVKELAESHKHLTITHGGTGGYRAPKPKQQPVEKLDKYCTDNNVVLLDLFRSFDKEQKNCLTEEAFRNALKHISAPLMEFERQKLIKEFATTPPPEALTGSEETGREAKPKDEDYQVVFVDYKLLVETVKVLKSGIPKEEPTAT